MSQLSWLGSVCIGEAKVGIEEKELARTKVHWQSSAEALAQILPTPHLDPSRAFMTTGFANNFFFLSKQSIKGEEKKQVTAWPATCCYSVTSHIVLSESKAGSGLFWGAIHTQVLGLSHICSSREAQILTCGWWAPELGWAKQAEPRAELAERSADSVHFSGKGGWESPSGTQAGKQSCCWCREVLSISSSVAARSPAAGTPPPGLAHVELAFHLLISPAASAG